MAGTAFLRVANPHKQHSNMATLPSSAKSPIGKAKSDKVLMSVILKYTSVTAMHCARVSLFSYGEFTTNSNKNIQFGIFVLWKTTK